MNTAVIVVLALFILLLVYGYLSNLQLTVEEYRVGEGVGKEPVRMVFLTDLHGGKFGANNRRLVKEIQRQKPDLICLAGDMIIKNGKGIDSCLALCKELVKLAPVFYSPGNHEIRLEEYGSFVFQLKKEGVNWLNNESRTAVIRERKFRITGLDIPEEYYHKFWQKTDFTQNYLDDNLGSAFEGGTQILLAHNPEYCRAYFAWGADVVLSGHVHGGILRLPFVGGVIDPSLRLFPQYTGGCYQSNSSVMILSRGLGTHHIRFRFFNPPELSVINFLD